MSVEYLFEPDQVRECLGTYKYIRDKIGDPSQEGKPAINFPKARKTDREIYRILSNQHYQHLQEFIRDLDLCLQEGWDQPKLLKIRSEKEFESTIAELVVATHFVKLGFKVSSFDQQKTRYPVPDGLAKRKDISCCFEVYAPRDWDGLRLFVEDLRLYILHLDIAYDFRCEIAMDVINDFDGDGRIVSFNPWQFSDKYETLVARANKIEPFISNVAIELQKAGGRDSRLELLDPSHNIATVLSCDRIQASQKITPSRVVSFSPPTLTGYAPEFMFDRLIQNRIIKKIGKEQTKTIGTGSICALFVDISHLEYQTEFKDPLYGKHFQESVGNHLDLNTTQTDIVLFFSIDRSQHTGIEVPILIKKTSVQDEDIRKLLGDQTLKDTVWISQ